MTVFPSTSSDGDAESFMHTALDSRTHPGHSAVYDSNSESQPHVTEINELKGQTLKWKIVIKDHPKRSICLNLYLYLLLILIFYRQALAELKKCINLKIYYSG